MRSGPSGNGGGRRRGGEREMETGWIDVGFGSWAFLRTAARHGMHLGAIRLVLGPAGWLTAQLQLLNPLQARRQRVVLGTHSSSRRQVNRRASRKPPPLHNTSTKPTAATTIKAPIHALPTPPPAAPPTAPPSLTSFHLLISTTPPTPPSTEAEPVITPKISVLLPPGQNLTSQPTPPPPPPAAASEAVKAGTTKVLARSSNAKLYASGHTLFAAALYPLQYSQQESAIKFSI